MENAKALVTSKTFQLAALQAIIGAIAVFTSAYPDVGWLLVAKSALDIYLRSKTNQSIGSVM